MYTESAGHASLTSSMYTESAGHASLTSNMYTESAGHASLTVFKGDDARNLLRM
jgi:hypothetical protein